MSFSARAFPPVIVPVAQRSDRDGEGLPHGVQRVLDHLRLVADGEPVRAEQIHNTVTVVTVVTAIAPCEDTVFCYPSQTCRWTIIATLILFFQAAAQGNNPKFRLDSMGGGCAEEYSKASSDRPLQKILNYFSSKSS